MAGQSAHKIIDVGDCSERTYWLSIPTPHLIDSQGKHVGLRSCHKAINGCKWDIVGLKTVVSITATYKSATIKRIAQTPKMSLREFSVHAQTLPTVRNYRIEARSNPASFILKKNNCTMWSVWTWLKISP